MINYTCVTREPVKVAEQMMAMSFHHSGLKIVVIISATCIGSKRPYVVHIQYIYISYTQNNKTYTFLNIIF